MPEDLADRNLVNRRQGGQGLTNALSSLKVAVKNSSSVFRSMFKTTGVSIIIRSTLINVKWVVNFNSLGPQFIELSVPLVGVPLSGNDPVTPCFLAICARRAFLSLSSKATTIRSVSK